MGQLAWGRLVESIHKCLKLKLCCKPMKLKGIDLEKKGQTACRNGRGSNIRLVVGSKKRVVHCQHINSRGREKCVDILVSSLQ